MNAIIADISRKAAVAFAAILCSVWLVASAQAVVIDFETFPAGPFASFSQSGVTFSAVGGGGQIITTSVLVPNGTLGLVDDNSPHKELQADIGAHASSVSVDLGDHDADADTLFLEIFNSSDVSLGFTSQLIDANFIGMKTLSLSAPDIAYAQFGARLPALNGSSVFADNFTFTAVPEPSTIILASAGLLGLFAVSIRRKA